MYSYERSYIYVAYAHITVKTIEPKDPQCECTTLHCMIVAHCVVVVANTQMVMVNYWAFFTVVWSTFCVMTVFLFYDLCVFVIYEAIGGDTRQCDSLYLLMLKSIYFFQWTIFMPMRLENNIMYKLTAYDEPSPLCCMNLFVHFSGHCWQCRHWLRLPNPMLFAGHMSTEMHCILRRWTNEV